MKNILIIGTTDNQGGAARVGWEIGNEMSSRGYDVKYIVGYKKSHSKNVYELFKPKILKYFDEHTRFNLTSLFRHLRSYILANNIDYGAYEEIINHPWYKEADIVHCHNLHGNFFKLESLIRISREKKTIWTFHDMWPITGKCVYIDNQDEWEDGYHNCKNLEAYPPMLWDNTDYMWHKKNDIYSKLLNTTIISPSIWLSKIIDKSMAKHIPHQTIHNGVDTNIFTNKDKDKMRKRLHLPLGKRIVIFTAQGGQNDPRKGWEYVDMLMKQHNTNEQLHFVCIGSGNKISQTNNLTLIPFVADKEKLSEYYNAADVLLFTSLAENCPLVVLEAMSCGLPVVSFEVGGVPELVKHMQNGYIAKFKDQKDLARGLNWVLTLSKKRYAQLSQTNRLRVRNSFSIKKMVDQYEKVYNQV